MARKITLTPSEVAEPVEVDLLGNDYTLRALTRSVQKDLEAAERELQALKDEDDSDKVVAVLAQGLDALLQKVDAKTATAAKVVKDGWAADKVSLGHISKLYHELQDAAVEQRPT